MSIRRLIFGDVNNYIGIFKPVETDLTAWRNNKARKILIIYLKLRKDKFYYSPVKCKGTV